jgi:hypothetical protein
MKKLTVFSATLALCSAPAFAQSPDTTSRPAQTPDSNSQSSETSRTGTATGANRTLTGCIMQRGSKYVLIPNNQSSGMTSTGQSGGQSQSSQSDTQSGQSGSQSSQSGTQSGQSSAQSNQSSGQSGSSGNQSMRGIELMSTQDLKQHVGHTVRVTGMMTGSSAMNNNSGTAGAENNSNSSSGSDTNSSANSQSSGTSGNSGTMNHRTMTVTDIQPVSQSCTAGAGSTGGASSQPR